MTTLSIARRLPLAGGKGGIPQLGYGVYRCPARVTTATTLHALSTGYRHIDTAGAYRNEHAVCAAVSNFLSTNNSVSRSDIFISSKFSPQLTGYEAAINAVQQSLSYFRSPLAIGDERLNNSAARADGQLRSGYPDDPAYDTSKLSAEDGLGYIDLYLIHAPVGTLEERNAAWKALVEAQKRGEIKHLGISNYSVVHMEQLLEFIAQEEENGIKEGKGPGWGGKIEVWQGELHPWLSRHDIRDFCAKHSIIIQAYCPIVRATRSEDPLILPLVEKYGKTAAQVLIRWSLQMGFVPLPKSEHNERIEENANVFDFTLTDEEVKTLDTGKYEPIAWDPTKWDPYN